MKKLILFILITPLISFSQEKEMNGTLYKNGPYVEAVRTLMNAYKSNNVKDVRNAYEKISTENIVFRDALNNLDEANPFGKNMDLEEEMDNMQKIFNAYDVVSIRELGYPDHLSYKEANDLVISWWLFTWKNKDSGNLGSIHLMVGHFFNPNGKMIGETYYLNPEKFPE